MARKTRLHIPGGLYHVMLRGNGGQTVFFADSDYHHFYQLLKEGVERFGHRIHAFCAMTNHLHLAVQVEEISLAKIVQNFSSRYTRWINWQRGRCGHLFQGRYKAILVDADSYLLELVRYIHLNPVRAKQITDPLDYPWSGHRTYLGQEHLPWLTTDWVLSRLADKTDVAQERYHWFIMEGLQEGYRDLFYDAKGDSRVLGDDYFMQHSLDKAALSPKQPLPSLDEIEKRVCLIYKVDPTELAGAGRRRQAAEARGVIGWLALQHELSSLREVAARYRRDGSTLSIATRKVDDKVRVSKDFREQINGLVLNAEDSLSIRA